MRTVVRIPFALCATLLVAGCVRAPSAPPSYPTEMFASAAVPHAAVAIAARLDAATGSGVPSVSGRSVEDAEQALAAAGLGAQVIAFGEGETVSAQFPEPGAAAPADRVVTLWLGVPPAPPPPPEPEPEPVFVAAPDPAPADPPRDHVGAGAPAVASQPAPDGPAAAQTPRRQSPRRMPPAEPGTLLSGTASWYGPGFAGRTTACGGMFDPAQLTLATRELRCGTRVLVTGPSGAAVEATVTDWGPAEWTNRRFDLSAATFAAIHHPGAGVITVTIQVLAP